MPTLDKQSLTHSFFAPLLDAFQICGPGRKRSSITNLDWSIGGIMRSLKQVQSGRDYLQSVSPDHLDQDWSRSSYFDALHSKTRLQEQQNLAKVISQQLMPQLVEDRLRSIPELDDFEIFAGDGHWHQHATHDPKKTRIQSKGGRLESSQCYYATGHLYGLNLRTRALTHLIHCDEINKRKEHDMAALKRLEMETLRQGAPKGRKVLWVWDRAAINYHQWYRWKCSAGIYFLSRAKENLNLEAAETVVDHSNPVNEGVQLDGYLVEGPQTQVRLVVYEDPMTGERFEFLTNLMQLEPGVIVQLYRMRWDVEKSFDALKNQFREVKAWATGTVAKTMQANFLTMAINLVTIFEAHLEAHHGIRNVPERKRKAKRLKELRKRLRKEGKKMPSLHGKLVRFTKTSVKFVRWLHTHLWKNTSWQLAERRLLIAYASL